MDQIFIDNTMPISSPQRTHPLGQILVVIGTSTSGPDIGVDYVYNHPRYYATPASMKADYESGDLVQAFDLASRAGAKHVYVVRLETDSLADLDECLDALIGFPAHIFFFASHYYGEEGVDDSIVDFCKEKSAIGEEVHCVIGSAAMTNEGDMPAWYSGMINDPIISGTTTPRYIDYRLDEELDVGHYLSVVAGHVYVRDEDDDSIYLTNGASCYAGLVASLPHYISPSGRIMAPALDLDPWLTATQRSTLTDLGYIMFDKITARGVLPQSDYTLSIGLAKSLRTSRSVSYICNRIRKGTAAVLGNPQTYYTKTTVIDQAVKQVLEAEKLLTILDYNYNINLSTDGTVIINMSLRPVNSVDYIDVNVSIDTR